MKFSSAVCKLNLTDNIQIKKIAAAKPGDVIMAQVLSKNSSYPFLEQKNGELSTIEIGDKIIGVLGSRKALRGFVGHAPKNLNNCKLSLLNMGGVIGCCEDYTIGLGEPPQLHYLGTLIDNEGIVNLKNSALPLISSISKPRPIILVLGTCMNVGKTYSATKMIAEATKAGFRVGAAKIAGVAALKDLNSFKKAGAVDVKSFLDCGLPSTVDTKDLAPIVKTLVNALQGDLIIIELGDGIMGHYKVETVLKNKEIMNNVIATIVCASDIASVYGAKHYLDGLGVEINIISGPATDNISGTSYIEENLGLAAINSFKFPQQLFAKSQLIWRASA